MFVLSVLWTPSLVDRVPEWLADKACFLWPTGYSIIFELFCEPSSLIYHLCRFKRIHNKTTYLNELFSHSAMKNYFSGLQLGPRDLMSMLSGVSGWGSGNVKIFEFSSPSSLPHWHPETFSWTGEHLKLLPILMWVLYCPEIMAFEVSSFLKQKTRRQGWHQRGAILPMSNYGRLMSLNTRPLQAAFALCNMYLF